MKAPSSIYLLLFSFFLFGCPNNDEPQTPQPAGGTCQLNSLTYDSDRTMVTDHYTYDALGRLLNGPRSHTMTYNSKGEIETANIWEDEYKFTYDQKGNIVKRVRRHKSSGSGTYITFFEYSGNGHLIQVTNLIAGGTFGNSYMESLYKPNIQQFLTDGLALYNVETNSSRKQSMMFELESLDCKMYSIDEAELKVTETQNIEKVYDYKLDRLEYVAAIRKYDGKKNAQNTKTWKWYNIISSNNDFSELGNIIDAYDPSPNVGSSFYKYSIKYKYNEAGYPVSSEVSGDFVGKGSTWIYDCK